MRFLTRRVKLSIHFSKDPFTSLSPNLGSNYAIEMQKFIHSKFCFTSVLSAFSKSCYQEQMAFTF